MTTTDDSPEHVPGQLGLVPDDVDDEVAAVRAELQRLQQLREQQTALAVDGVAGSAAAWRAAAAELDVAVVRARAAGATWDEIGAAAGMTRQGAWKRWGDR